jgi:secondary thiamine-phosphate synthase enzyme
MTDLKIRTESRVALVDITEQVNRAVAESKVLSGLCNLFVPHTTAGVIVSENWDADVTRDMLMQFERMAPSRWRLSPRRRQFAGAHPVGDGFDFDQHPDPRRAPRARTLAGSDVRGI